MDGQIQVILIDALYGNLSWIYVMLSFLSFITYLILFPRRIANGRILVFFACISAIRTHAIAWRAFVNHKN